MRAEKAQLCCQEWQAGPHGAQAQGEGRLIPDISFTAGLYMSTKKCQQKLITIYSGRCYKVRKARTHMGESDT